jgi:ADP-ribose pyrophosphatase YjhB (NUDIX family)
VEEGTRREMKEETGLDVNLRGIITVMDLFGCDDPSKQWDPNTMQVTELSYHYTVVEFLCTIAADQQGLPTLNSYSSSSQSRE